MDYTEESHSGPLRGFAKPLSLNKARVGSNPTSSAKQKYDTITVSRGRGRIVGLVRLS